MSTAIISNANDAPFRILANALSKENLAMEATTLKKDAAIKEKGLDAKAIIDGMYKGDVANGAVMVGQDVVLINEIIDDGYKRLA